MENIIQNAKDKKYTDFSNAVKKELDDRLNNNPKNQQFASDYEKIQQTKELFKKITQPEQEPNSEE